MRKNTPYLLIVILSVVMSSCALFKKDEQTMKEESVIPQDREAIQKSEPVKTFQPERLAGGDIMGDWAIEEVMGKKAVGEKAPFLKFTRQGTQLRMYGNNGCNTINASFKFQPKDSTLTFDNVITTMMYCGMEGITDREINQALEQTRYYSLTKTDDYYYMRLFNKNHSELMLLMHQNFEFLNGAWKVTKINDKDLEVDEMILVFDVDEKKIHGNTGCNVMNGTFETDMDSPNSISIGNLAVTMMLCPDMDMERALLLALEDANQAKPINADDVQLLNSDNKVVLLMHRYDVKNK